MKKVITFLLAIALLPLFYIYYPLMYSPVPLEQPLLTFRFDDAFLSQEEALTELHRHRLTATLFVINSATGTSGYMDLDRLKKHADRGFEIGFHSNGHPNLLLLTGENHRREISPAKFTDSGKFKIPVSFAYPYGFYNPFYLAQVRKEYPGACTYPVLRRGGFNDRNSKPWLLDCIEIADSLQFNTLLNMAVRKKLWLVACFHHISTDTGPYSISLDEFRKITAIASDKEKTNEVKVVTIAEGVKILKKATP